MSDDAPTDTFLSTSPEWHAFGHGVYKGLTSHPLRTPPEPDKEDVRKESHYYRGGYVVGTILQLAIAGVLLWRFGPGAVTPFLGLS